MTSSDAIPVDVWQFGYTTILRCNNIIDAKVTGSGAAAIVAQAMAIRALCYFKLVMFYGTPYTVDTTQLGVPLVLHSAPFALPTRNTVGTVYTQIVSDLTAAIPNAPDFSSSVYLSKYAMEGLLAKVYMYMGDYTKAESEAMDVI